VVGVQAVGVQAVALRGGGGHQFMILVLFLSFLVLFVI
jgi:hypothetical protein